MVGEVDGRFTRTNFENGEGNLYKGIMSTDQDNNPYYEDEYRYASQSNFLTTLVTGLKVKRSGRSSIEIGRSKMAFIGLRAKLT